MKISGIDHVEFYVGDAQQTAFYLCTAFGFRICGQGGPETGLPGQRSLLLRQGDIQLVLTSGLADDHPAAEYVRRHGDGVAVIAFGTDDPALAQAEAVRLGATAVEAPREYAAGGARAVTATVSGFGDVAHRFVVRERAGEDPGEQFLPGAFEQFLPGAFEMMAADPDPGDGLLHLLDHVAVCLPAGTLERTVEYYRTVFGFSQIFQERIEVGEQAMDSKVVQSPSGTVTFTLIEPDVNLRPGQIDQFLGAHGGAGVQHLAFLTHDIVTAVRRFGERGAEFLTTPDSYYDRLAARLGDVDLPVDRLRETSVLVDSDHWGQMFQIFTRSMHVRRTFFLEIIDRHGALTFGSGNIKALYEAVERDRAASSTGAAR